MSFNVSGGNNVIKCKKLLSWPKKERVNIALLQEIQLTDKEHEKLRRDWAGQVYYSSLSANKREVTIFINKNTPFTIEKMSKISARLLRVNNWFPIWGAHFDTLVILMKKNFILNFLQKLLLYHCPLLSWQETLIA